MLKNKDGGLAKAIPLLLCGGWVQGVCLCLVSEKQCRNKEEATGSRCGKFGVSCRGKDLMSRGPGAGKPTPPKYDVLSQTRRRRRPGGGRAVRRGAGAWWYMPVPGGCRRQSKNEDSHKDVDVRAPRRTKRIASV